MRYRVKLRPEPTAAAVPVDLVEGPSGALTASVAGRDVEVDVVRIGAQLSVRVDGRVVDLSAVGALPDLAIVTGDWRGRVHVESDRTRTVANPSARQALPTALISPMPGRVVRIGVAVGDAVVAGQTLIVLEAMKMENEVVAARPGKVLEIHVTAGAAVEANAKLVTLAPAGEQPPPASQ